MILAARVHLQLDVFGFRLKRRARINLPDLDQMEGGLRRRSQEQRQKCRCDGGQLGGGLPSHRTKIRLEGATGSGDDSPGYTENLPHDRGRSFDPVLTGATLSLKYS